MVAAPNAVSWTARCKQLAAIPVAAAMLFGVAWMFGSIPLDAGREVWQGRASRDWQQATAMVERSELIVKGGRGTRYIPHIVYRYEVGGRTFRSSVIEATPSSRYNRKRASEVLAAYQVGMAVPVFHDGEGHSVLRQGVRAPSWIALILGGSYCLGLLAILMHMLNSLRRKSAA